MLAAEHYDQPEPVNIGAGYEISIKELTQTIVNLTEFKGKLIWDSSKPDGQPRRMLDTSKAERDFGFRARMDFIEGLRRTVEWYKSEKCNQS